MNLLSWNVREMNSKAKMLAVEKEISNSNCGIGVLCETKIRQGNAAMEMQVRKGGDGNELVGKEVSLPPPCKDHSLASKERNGAETTLRFLYEDHQLER